MVNPGLFVAFSLLLTFAEVMSNEPNVANCPEIYQRFSTSHTYCQPRNASCKILARKVTDDQSVEILQLHNDLRSIIANQGKQSDGLPPASDMMVLEWDKELAAIAQKNVDRCLYEHDEGDQRRVRNFGVGQNLAKQEITGEEKPQPDWKWAVQAWYSEIEFFKKDMICGSREAASEEEETGHFTQLIWATSFRVGCGYTMFKEGKTFYRYYACNYGPAGNVDGACVYDEGKACSKCPANTECSKDPKTKGLCKRTSDAAPYFPIKEPTIFNCNFRDPKSKDCQFHRVGDNKWSLVPALSGQFIETILQPGQKTELQFKNQIVGAESDKKMCVQIRYRKGPTLAKDQQNIQGEAIFTIPSANNFAAPFKLPTYNGKFTQKFSVYKMTLGWFSPTDMKITCEVPQGATPQFLDIESIVGFSGSKCPKLEVI